MKKNWKFIIGALFLVGGLGCVASDLGAAAFGIIIGVALISWWATDQKKGAEKSDETSPPAGTPSSPPGQHIVHTPSEEPGNSQVKQQSKSVVSISAYNSLQTTQFYDQLREIPRVEIVPSMSVAGPHFDGEQDLTFKSTNITSRTPINRLKTYFVVDVETTGLNVHRDEIVQVSAIRFESFIPTEAFSTYVKPRKGLNPQAARINGITAEDVENAPYMEEILDQLNAFLMAKPGELPPIVGHNLRFDYNFLLENGVYAVAENRKLYDTLALSRREYSDLSVYKLDYLSKVVLDISRTDAHDSLSDALVTGLLFKRICQDRIEF